MCFALIIILVAVQAAVAAPSPDTYVFNEIIPFLNATVYLLDGPANVSYAPTKPTTNLRPSLEQMKYYNYYCASMYCQYQLNDLSCKYCQKFKRDVSWQRGKKTFFLKESTYIYVSNSLLKFSVDEQRYGQYSLNYSFD